MLDHFLPLLFPQGFRISKHIGHPTSGSGDKRTVKRYLKSEKVILKNIFLRGNFRQLSNKNIQMLDHFFQLLFPKESESLKIFDIQFREVGSKRPLNRYLKSEQTNGQTDRRTNRLIESIGPEGQCFENLFNSWPNPTLKITKELVVDPCRIL